MTINCDCNSHGCFQAVQLGAVYPNKLWVLYGMEGGAWWEWELATPTKCSNKEVKKFLDKAITIVPLFDGEVKGNESTTGNVRVYYNINTYHADVGCVASMCL